MSSFQDPLKACRGLAALWGPREDYHQGGVDTEVLGHLTETTGI